MPKATLMKENIWIDFLFKRL